MTLYLVLALLGTSVALTVVAVADLATWRPRNLARQLSTVQQLSRGMDSATRARAAESSRARFTRLLGQLGQYMQRRGNSAETVRDLLVQAGYRRPEASSVFWGARIALVIALPTLLAVLGLMLGLAAAGAFVAIAWGAITAWIAPRLYLRTRARARRREIELNLPDALDLLVVCIEAGLGLNLAFARMADEIRHFSPATSQEFALVNLEMRAGVPRDEALRTLGTRMDVSELRSLATMLIQADRFGTSIAQALRVHADTARNKRRQRAEEAAAKTTIKLIFPLVLCVFPTVFVVILAPAIIGIIRSFGGM